MDIAERGKPEEGYNITQQVSTKRRGKKRSSCLSKGIKKREKANDRERSRMADIRGGFKLLRKKIPGKYAPTFKYLPKIKILQFAMTYISELSDILQSDEVQNINFSGKSYPLHKTSKLPIEETMDQCRSELTPPTSEDEGENIIFRFDDISISQLQSSTNQTTDESLEAENTNFDCEQYLKNIPGYLTPDVQSPAPETTRTDTDNFQVINELEELLTPSSTEFDENFNLEDYLEEDIGSPVTKCGPEDLYKLGVYPDFSDILTPTECDEILSQIA